MTKTLKRLDTLCVLTALLILAGCSNPVVNGGEPPKLNGNLTVKTVAGGILKLYSDAAYQIEISDLATIVPGTTVYLKAVPDNDTIEVTDIIGANTGTYTDGGNSAVVTVTEESKTIIPAFGTKGLDINGGLVTSYDNSSPTVIIPASKSGVGVTSIDYGAFGGCSSLTEVTIPSSVTSIGDYAFFDCSSLIELTIPSSVTSIGTGAFGGCNSLTSVTIPSSVTSISESAFENCSSLTEVIIPSSVTSICGSAFSGCSSLTEVTIPSSVISIGDYAFFDCSNLTEVTVSSNVTSIGTDAFSGCSSLTEVTIPASVTSIGYGAFQGCSSLISVRVEAVDPPLLGDYTFYDCNALSEITVPFASINNYKAAVNWINYKNIITDIK